MNNDPVRLFIWSSCSCELPGFALYPGLLILPCLHQLPTVRCDVRSPVSLQGLDVKEGMKTKKEKSGRNAIAVVMAERFKHTGGPMRDRRERRPKDSRRDPRREQYLFDEGAVSARVIPFEPPEAEELPLWHGSRDVEVLVEQPPRSKQTVNISTV